VSSTAVVSWVIQGATVTLPPASTPGQLVILIAATNGFSNGIKAQAGTGDNTYDYNAANFAVATVGAYSTMEFVSDGLGNWYIVNVN
jgi:hypothetical protein